DVAATRDGAYSVMETRATNLVWYHDDTNGAPDVVMHDNGGGNFLVSANPAGNAGNGASTHPVANNDGHWVAFRSTARDLVTGDNAPADRAQVYLRDTDQGKTYLVSGNSPRDADPVA